MKVPTILNPPSQAPGQFVQGVGTADKEAGTAVSQGLDVLVKSLERHKLKVDEEQKNLDTFDLNQTFLAHANDTQQKFDDAKNSPAGAAPDFAQLYSTDLKNEQDKMVTDAQAQGYHGEALQHFQTQLSMLHNSQFGQAVAFQDQQAGVQAGIDLDKSAQIGSDYLVSHPEAVDSVKTYLHDQFMLHPHIPPAEAEKMFQAKWDTIRPLAGAAYTASHPDEVIQAYDPDGHFARKLAEAGIRPPGSSAPTSLTLEGLRPLFVAQESRGNYKAVNTKTGALGRYQVMPATGENLAGRIGVPWQPDLMKQDTPEAKAYQDKIGDAAIQDSIDHGHGDAAAIFSHYYSGSTTAYKNAKGNPKTAKYVQDMLGRVGAQPALADQSVATNPAAQGQRYNADGAPLPVATTGPQTVVVGNQHGPDPYPEFPIVANPDKSQWDKRGDGSDKGMGFLGLRQRPDGKVSSEISVGNMINGKETEYPLMVPGLSTQQVSYLMTNNPETTWQKPYDQMSPIEKSIEDKAMAHAKARVDQGLSPFAQPNESPQVVSSPQEAQLLTMTTGNPALDSLHGAERLKVVEQAYTTHYANEERAATAAAKAQREAEAAQKQQHETAFNGLLNDLYDDKQGQTAIDTWQAQGKFADYSERMRAQKILDDKQNENKALDFYTALINSGQKGNPFDSMSQQAAEAGFQQAVKISQADPAKYGNATPLDVALQVWNSTGVIPKSGANIIRNGLISADPKTIASAASVAANMLDHNPNAFAGVDGGEKIVEAAHNYTHSVDDLGMTAQDAAAKIQMMNDPKLKVALDLNAPARAKFEKDLRAQDITAVMNKALGNDYSMLNIFAPNKAVFGGEPQKAEALKTFGELAVDYYDKYHDEPAAIAHAQAEMKRFYGLANGEIVKYPHSRAYPVVDGNHDYILKQAQGDIRAYTGLDVPIENIWLQPATGGRTADAFKAGKVVPYELHYITTGEGYTRYNVVPGKLFTADVGKAQGEVAGARAAEVRSHRQRQEDADTARALAAPIFGVP